MKKKVIAGLLVMMTLAFACGCAKQGSEAPGQGAGTVESAQQAQETEKTPLAEGIALREVPVEEYVTLPDYKTFEIETAKASQATVKQQARELYLSVFPEEMGVKDRPVVEGDTANIDYVGKKDGVAFAGGTANGYNLTIGSGQFIDGFEAGLVGVTPGETVDLPLRFPDGYGNEELSGAEVIFTVTVNYLIPEEMQDEVIPSLGLDGVSDVETYLKKVEEDINANLRIDAENQCVLELVKQSTFDTLPEILLGSYKDDMRERVENTAAVYGMDGSEFSLAYYGMELEELVEAQAKQSLQLNMACQAVANLENLNVDDATLEERLASDAEAAGKSVEELLGDATKEDYRNYLMYLNVIEYLGKQNLDR